MFLISLTWGNVIPSVDPWSRTGKERRREKKTKRFLIFWKCQEMMPFYLRAFIYFPFRYPFFRRFHFCFFPMILRILSCCTWMIDDIKFYFHKLEPSQKCEKQNGMPTQNGVILAQSNRQKCNTCNTVRADWVSNSCGPLVLAFPRLKRALCKRLTVGNAIVTMFRGCEREVGHR